MSSVKLVCISKPVIDGVNSAEELVAYAARVSNPANQINNETAPRLLAYLMKNSHWSPLEMVSLTVEIVTTRDIARQILRHRSFSFQEFSQRYAAVTAAPILREARLQDQKNRQNSIEIDDAALQQAWEAMQRDAAQICHSHYQNALNLGIAKEVARSVLPEGLTESTLYMAGTLRSFIHYTQLRCANGTQKEHREVALQIRDILHDQFPSITGLLGE